MASAKLLAELPHPELMRDRLRMMNLLDAIMAPDTRSFEWHPKWGRGEQLAAFKDGEGNFFFAWFSPRGAVLRGFDHDSAMSPFRHEPPSPWPGLFDGLPASLGYVLEEPAFVQEEVTFCLWNVGDGWQAGRVQRPPGKKADGADWLLGCFRKRFRDWAETHYHSKLEGAALTKLWWGREALTTADVRALNPEADLKAVRAEAKLLGWPVALDDKAAARAPAKPSKPAAPARPAASRKPAPGKRSFGAASFTVVCEPSKVSMLIHDGKQTVASAKVDVYEELFDLVKARLKTAQRTGK